MQILGLSSSTPKSESRLKTLFWPTVRSVSDVDVIAWQGFWVCFIVAVVTLVVCILQRAIGLGLFQAAFFFLGGVGSRQRNRFATITVFSMYLLSAIVMLHITGQGFGIVRIIFLALLFANARATWLSAKWSATTASTLAKPMHETLGDKLSDNLPVFLWPKLKWLFYALTVLEGILLLLALLVPRH